MIWYRRESRFTATRFSPRSTQRLRPFPDTSPNGTKSLNDEIPQPLRPTSYKLWYPEAGMSMAQYDKAMEQWGKLLREIGRKQQLRIRLSDVLKLPSDG